MGHKSNVMWYGANSTLVYTLIAIFFFVSSIDLSLYYLIKVLFYGLIIIGRWTDHSYLNNVDRICTGILPILWILLHAVTHTTTCHTSELMRSNMWLDIIVHTLSAYLTAGTYIRHYAFHQTPFGSKHFLSRFLPNFKLSMIYLTIVAIWCSLSCYVSYNHVQTPEDGDRLFPWWIGPGLSFVNFTTVNVYNQPIFSKRLLVELLIGSFVFVTEVTNIIPTCMYVTTRYFETYLLGALFCRHYIDFDTLLSDPSKAAHKAVEKADANVHTFVNDFVNTKPRTD